MKPVDAGTRQVVRPAGAALVSGGGGAHGARAGGEGIVAGKQAVDQGLTG